MSVLEKNINIYYRTNQIPSKARLIIFFRLLLCAFFFFSKNQSSTEGLLNGRNNTGLNVHKLNSFYFSFVLFLKWGILQFEEMVKTRLWLWFESTAAGDSATVCSRKGKILHRKDLISQKRFSHHFVHASAI